MRKNDQKWPVYHPYQLNRFSDDLETYARTLVFFMCIYMSDFVQIGLWESGQKRGTDIYKRLTSLCQQTQVSLVSSLCLYKTQPSRMTLAREKSNRIYWSTLRPTGGKRSRTRPTKVGAKPTSVNHEIKQCGRKTLGSSQWSTYLVNHSAFAAHCSDIQSPILEF